MNFRCMLASLLLSGSIGFAATPTDSIQGNWLGTWEGRGDIGGKNVAQIYGLGNGEYQAIFTAYDSGEQDSGVFTFAIRGTSVSETRVEFNQNLDLGLLGKFTFHAVVENGQLHGKYSNGKRYEGTMALERVENRPETVGAKPLPGATVLFDGSNLDHWLVDGAAPSTWKILDGVIVAPQAERPSPFSNGHLTSREIFDDAQIHLEFRVPYLPERRGEERGQSGIFLQGRYELQIVDSFGFPRAKDASGDFADLEAAGAIHGQHAPLEQAALPPGEWQAFDITYFAVKRDPEGKVIKPAEVALQLNGKLVQDRRELHEPTKEAPITKPEMPAGLILQNAGYPVEFRNIWIVKLNAPS